MAQLDVLDTAGSQLRVGYDASHYLEFSVSSAGVISIKESATERGQIALGVLAWGTTVTTGASAGDVVLKNAAALRGVLAAGTSSLPLVRLDSNNILQLGTPSSGLYCALGVSATAAASNAALAGAVVLVGTDLVYYDSTGTRRTITGATF